MDAEVLVTELDRALPGFAAYVGSDDNLFERDTLHAVFAACSHFVSDGAISADAWSSVAAIVNRAVDGSDEVLSEAARTCFLENLAAIEHPIKPFLRGEALRYWNHWQGDG